MTELASAQGPVYRGYRGQYSSPWGPTISPYLDYFRRDSGLIDPYNAFVRPRRQVQNQIDEVRAQQQYQDTQLRREIQGVRQSLAAPTGRRASFGVNSRSYQFPTLPSRNAR
jgi:hypothetical protein